MKMKLHDMLFQTSVVSFLVEHKKRHFE